MCVFRKLSDWVGPGEGASSLCRYAEMSVYATLTTPALNVKSSTIWNRKLSRHVADKECVNSSTAVHIPAEFTIFKMQGYGGILLRGYRRLHGSLVCLFVCLWCPAQ